MIGRSLAPLSDDERRACAEAGIAVYADRLILEAQPPADDAVLAEVAEHCAGPLPMPVADLWRTTFGGSLHYDLRAEVGGDDVPISLRELFHPGSDGYRDLWGWIEHERELIGGGLLTYLPIGGFEYLDRVYVSAADGPGHGAVVCWQMGLPPGWELTDGDRVASMAADLPALFAELVLESDPWEAGHDGGTELSDAVDALSGSADAPARAAAAKLRRLVQATVLDWRGALRAGTIAGQRRLRRSALDRAAAGDDLAVMQALVAQGCDPAEQVRGGLTPVDVALSHRAFAVVRWLLQRQVPVPDTLRVGAHAAGPELAAELLRRGATVDASALGSAVNNDDIAVLELLSRAYRADGDNPEWLRRRLREKAAQAAAGRPGADVTREQHRAEVLTRTADILDRTAAS